MTDPMEDHQFTNEPPPAGSLARRPKHRWWWLVLVVLLVLAGIYVLSGRAGKPSAKSAARPAPTPAPVLAQPARRGDVGIYLNGLGTVTALNTVTVRSRVDGQLMEVRFREGQNVRRGDLLAVIDPRPFQVQLTQAEGVMAKDTALLKNAQVDLQRYRLLWAQDSVPKQQLDTQESLVRQLEASLKVDQGQIDAARLQLTYCRITSPVSGRVGLRQVDVGNIIHVADTNGLVVVTQLQPATVLFPIPEDSVPAVVAKLRSGARLTVEAYDREQKVKLATGSLLTIDNQIDPATGTVRLKAVFPNERNELFPNQFVNAKLLLEIRRQTVLVPTSAIQRGPQGTFVYLVRPDRTVTVRPVTIGVTQGDDTAILSGLAEKDLVVVEGAERLREGSKVDLGQPRRPRQGTGSAGASPPSGVQGTGGQGANGGGIQGGQPSGQGAAPVLQPGGVERGGSGPGTTGSYSR